MTVTLETIFNAKEALTAFSQKELSIATSYRVAKLLKTVNAELETFNTQRIKLLQDIGSTLSEDGTQYTIPTDKRAEFAEKFSQLLAVTVEMPNKIDISGENISISPDLLMALEPFVNIEV